MYPTLSLCKEEHTHNTVDDDLKCSFSLIDLNVIYLFVKIVKIAFLFHEMRESEIRGLAVCVTRDLIYACMRRVCLVAILSF